MVDKEDLTWIKLWLSSFPSSSRPVTPWHLSSTAAAAAQPGAVNSIKSEPSIKAPGPQINHHLNHQLHLNHNPHHQGHLGNSVGHNSLTPFAGSGSSSLSGQLALGGSVMPPPNMSHGGTSKKSKKNQNNQVPQQQRRSSASGLFSKIIHDFNCDSCNTKFEDKAGVLVHHPCYYNKRGLNKGAMEGRGKLYICDIFGCGKTFSLLNNLRNHTKFHIQEYNFQCNFCSHQTKIKGDMVKHSRTHTGERPFPCPYCGKDFRESRSLDNHIRTHTGEKPYRCDWKLCTKNFATSSELNVHKKRVHTMERNFRCPFIGCSAAYVTNRERVAHVKASHPGFMPTDEQLRQGFKGKNKLAKLAGQQQQLAAQQAAAAAAAHQAQMNMMHGQPVVQVQVMPSSSQNILAASAAAGLPNASTSTATHVLVGDLVANADPRQQVFRFPIINLI